MWNIWITVFGFFFLFVMTTLGASVVFLFKGESFERNQPVKEEKSKGS